MLFPILITNFNPDVEVACIFVPLKYAGMENFNINPFPTLAIDLFGKISGRWFTSDNVIVSSCFIIPAGTVTLLPSASWIIPPSAALIVAVLKETSELVVVELGDDEVDSMGDCAAGVFVEDFVDAKYQIPLAIIIKKTTIMTTNAPNPFLFFITFIISYGKLS